MRRSRRGVVSQGKEYKEDGLLVQKFSTMGRGIVANKVFELGDFVCEYKGELVTAEEGYKREEIGNGPSYLYFFRWKSQNLCIDATKEDDTFGRLINHSIPGNVRPRIIALNDQPKILFFATMTIAKGSQLFYDYGEKRKEVIERNPWLKRTKAQYFKDSIKVLPLKKRKLEPAPISHSSKDDCSNSGECDPPNVTLVESTTQLSPEVKDPKGIVDASNSGDCDPQIVTLVGNSTQLSPEVKDPAPISHCSEEIVDCSNSVSRRLHVENDGYQTVYEVAIHPSNDSFHSLLAELDDVSQTGTEFGSERSVKQIFYPSNPNDMVQVNAFVDYALGKNTSCLKDVKRNLNLEFGSGDSDHTPPITSGEMPPPNSTIPLVDCGNTGDSDPPNVTLVESTTTQLSPEIKDPAPISHCSKEIVDCGNSGAFDPQIVTLVGNSTQLSPEVKERKYPLRPRYSRVQFLKTMEEDDEEGHDFSAGSSDNYGDSSKRLSRLSINNVKPISGAYKDPFNFNTVERLPAQLCLEIKDPIDLSPVSRRLHDKNDGYQTVNEVGITPSNDSFHSLLAELDAVSQTGTEFGSERSDKQIFYPSNPNDMVQVNAFVDYALEKNTSCLKDVKRNLNLEFGSGDSDHTPPITSGEMPPPNSTIPLVDCGNTGDSDPPNVTLVESTTTQLSPEIKDPAPISHCSKEIVDCGNSGECDKPNVTLVGSTTTRLSPEIKERKYPLRPRYSRVQFLETMEEDDEEGHDFSAGSSDYYEDSSYSETDSDDHLFESEDEENSTDVKQLEEKPVQENASGEKSTTSEPLGENPSKTNSIEENLTTTEQVANGMILDSDSCDSELGSLSKNLVKVAKISKKRTVNKRDWTKSFACVYCEKQVLKLVEHLSSMHKNEPSVAEMLALPVRSKERNVAITKIRNAGAYKHNEKVISTGKGVLQVKKRTRRAISPSDYRSCPYCGMKYQVETLYRHKRVCLEKPVKGKFSSRGNNVVSSNPATYHKDYFENVILKNFKMNDEITAAIKNDELICEFGIILVEQFSANPEQDNNIRGILRIMGRFLVTLKKAKNAIQKLEDAFHPDHFDACIDAALSVAGYDVTTNKFKSPSNAKRIGEHLEKIAAILVKRAIKSRSEEARQLVNDFLYLRKEDWSRKVSSKASLQLKEAKYNSENPLPDKEDVVKLADYLCQQTPLAFAKFKNNPTPVTYNDLSTLVLCTVVFVNRKRPGDVHKLHLEDYRKEPDNRTHSDIWKSLNSEEKELVKSLKRVETRGKKFMKVPILFTKQMQDSIQLLISNRTNCGVPAENPFLFAKVGGMKHQRGSDTLRLCRENAGCLNQKRMTATSLRKEAATLAKVAGLTELQVCELADFLGHDIRTHQQHYRIPESTMQTAKVSKYLLSLSKGSKASGQNSSELEDASSATEDVPEDQPSTSTAGHTQKDHQPSTPKTPQNKKKPNQLRRKNRDSSDSDDDAEAIFAPQRKKRMTKRRWDTPQREAVEKYCGSSIALGLIPGKKILLQAIKHKELRQRTWQNVKDYCRNKIDRMKKEGKH